MVERRPPSLLRAPDCRADLWKGGSPNLRPYRNMERRFSKPPALPYYGKAVSKPPAICRRIAPTFLLLSKKQKNPHIILDTTTKVFSQFQVSRLSWSADLRVSRVTVLWKGGSPNLRLVPCHGKEVLQTSGQSYSDTTTLIYFLTKEHKDKSFNIVDLIPHHSDL